MSAQRQAAFETLYRICYDSAYSNIAVDNALSQLNEGKAFTARIVYGVLERLITLDYIIDRFCDKPKPKLRIILRMGVYQLYFMDKVSTAAAIDESVKLAKANGLKYYSSFINAVLHKVDSNRINIDELDDISVRYSVPQSLINMWIKAYGRETVLQYLPGLNEAPPVFAVPNSFNTDADALCTKLMGEGVRCSVFEDIVKITSSPDLTSLEAFKNGFFYIQDVNCYKAIKALDIKQGERVIDVCAAPGGKSFTAAMFAGKSGEVLSFDLHKSRISLIKEAAGRLGLTNISADVNDACVFNDRIGSADKVICDVPCSGYGIVRRKPEIRYKELDSIKGLPDIQLKILNVSAGYLKNGGRLLYSTCTLNRRENEAVIDRFLNENKAFSVLQMKTLFPGENDGDGFFYCVLERK